LLSAALAKIRSTFSVNYKLRNNKPSLFVVSTQDVLKFGQTRNAYKQNHTNEIRLFLAMYCIISDTLS